MKRFFYIISIILLFTSAIFADVYMKQQNHSDAVSIMGQNKPAEDTVDEIWITGQGLRSDNPKRSMIMQSGTGKMIMIDHQKKEYAEMPMDISKAMPQTKGASGEDMEKYRNMMNNMMKVQANVQPTSETKTIRGWKCKKYNMTMTMMMGNINMEIWATEDIQVDDTEYLNFQSSALMNMPGLGQAIESIKSEMKKIKGIQVLTNTTNQMMGQNMKSSMELLEYKTGTAPQGLFVIPAGYKKKSMMK